MSTPKTDAAVLTVAAPSIFSADTIDVVTVEFARDLERENATLAARVDDASDQIRQYVEIIASLRAQLEASERLNSEPSSPVGFAARSTLSGHVIRDFALPSERHDLADGFEWIPVYDRPQQRPATARCHCRAQEWPDDCVQIEDSHGRLHTSRGCQPGAAVTKHAPSAPTADGER